ncbi:hypothetical protein [Spirochaeta africana]|uniref:Uncharacterized protein n=1 Tax=Spirochaeta africana (strain ATCC 700263 / DSM 8902 / Z-7692) TaxID=889378 RepID=H9UFH9_SPIAZ|nr:hypothetical protein [Spirochaeta africana]AFG36272.1 hypothetical protein Spiaf_0163 [Spirochaeta africana DSM 8902]
MDEEKNERARNKNRVYVIDRECYVIYMGKADRKYRPFLRIGTSAFIPRDIRRHIGSVVLTDRMTGNYFLEADCLEKPVSHHMHYVGSPDLVDAVRHFIRNEQIADQPLGPPTDVEKEEGGRVVFYGDGNLRAFLDGHRLFDLFESEKRDRHSLYQLQRVHDIVNGLRGAYRAQDLAGTGFVLLPNGAPLLFDNGVLQSVYLDEATVEHTAYAMLPLGLLQRFSGSGRRDAVLNVCKWHKTRTEALEFVLADNAGSADPDSPVGQADALLHLMEQAGVACRNVAGVVLRPDIPGLSCIPQELGLQMHDRLAPPAECVLQPPEGCDWRGAVHPPLLQEVLYRLGTTATAKSLQTAQTALQRIMGKEARDQLKNYAELSEEERRQQIRKISEDADHIVQLTVRLWAWNQRELGQEVADAAMLAGEIETAHRLVRMPLKAAARRQGQGIGIVFMPPDGMSRGVIDACAKGREKIAAALEIPDRQSYFESERARLSATLQDLLASRHVAPVAAPVAPEGAAGRAAGSEASGDQRAAGEGRSGDSRPEGARPVAGSVWDAPSTGPVRRKRERKSRRFLLVAVLLALLGAVLLAGIRLGWLDSIAQRGVAILAPADPAEQPAAASRHPVEDADLPDTVADTAADREADADRDAIVDREAETADETGLPGDAEAAGPRWTIQEVLRVTNWIAYNNGYALIGQDALQSRDPDWIYPDNEFTLPDGSRHRVRQGESMWRIATGFLADMYASSRMEREEFRAFIKNLDYTQTVRQWNEQ